MTRLTSSQVRNVLGRLLERHPELLSEAEASIGADRAAGAKLAGPSVEDVAQAVCNAVCSLELEDLTQRAGSHSWGYVGPGEAAGELLAESVSDWTEEWQQELQRGDIAGAVITCLGIVTGLYRARSTARRSDGPLGWDPDFLIEHACLTVRDLLLACPKASRKPTAGKLITALAGAAPDWEDGLRRSWMEGLNGK
ncbi:MAG: hypothetical protein KF833_17130 [Verrucomicrobiae bacterium]|nr:hypothetical protein [Verrucomicrobiae bacterium]